jgi:hypothetical protein
MSEELVFTMIVTHDKITGRYQCNLFPADILPVGSVAYGNELKPIVDKSLERFYKDKEKHEQELEEYQRKAEENHRMMTDIIGKAEEALKDLKKQDGENA